MHFTPVDRPRNAPPSKHDVYFEGNKKNELNELRTYIYLYADTSKIFFPILKCTNRGKKSSRRLSTIQLKALTLLDFIPKWSLPQPPKISYKKN